MSVDHKEDMPIDPDDEKGCTNIIDVTAPKSFLVIENLYFWHSGVTVGLGSLFLTDDGLYFIEYYQPTIGTVEVGGSLSSGAIRDSINIAGKLKQEEWGLPIAEIYRRHAQSSMVPRHEIKRIDLIRIKGPKKEHTEPQNVAVHLLKGNTLNFLRMDSLSFGHPWIEDKEHDLDKYAGELIGYGQGLDVFDPEHWTRYGLSIDFPAPLIFIESVLSGSFHSVFSNEMLPKMAGESKYMGTLFTLVDEKQDAKEQRDLLNFILELPEFFRSEFKKRLSEELSPQGCLLIATTSILVLGCIIIGVIAFMNFSRSFDDWPGWPTFFGFLFIAVGLYGTITERAKRNRYKTFIEKAK